MRDLTDKEKKALPTVEALSDDQLITLYDKFDITYDKNLSRDEANRLFIATIGDWVGGFYQ